MSVCYVMFACYVCTICLSQTSDRWRSYNRVWMIDVRDSFFQADPFSFTPSPSPGSLYSKSFFYIFTGVESRTIGQCGWNGGWIKVCFGDKVYIVYRLVYVFHNISVRLSLSFSLLRMDI